MDMSLVTDMRKQSYQSKCHVIKSIREQEVKTHSFLGSPVAKLVRYSIHSWNCISSVWMIPADKTSKPRVAKHVGHAMILTALIYQVRLGDLCDEANETGLLS